MTPDAAARSRTFHHAQWDAAGVAAALRDRGVSVDVIIPARNEAATIGHVVGTLHRTLVEEHAVIDDLVVVDSHSDDETAALAAAAGARVLEQADVLPDVAPTEVRGKGAAMWKGLAATSSDLVVFVDGDIANMDPRFVVGLVGALVARDDLDYVKGFYDRRGPGGVRGQGGRVTELVARPLLSAHWPDLAFLVQPLSGEYAGRRAVLESVPFVHHYGVELGLLIDIATAVGADRIGQVDLVERVHDHQDLAALGRMAAQIHLLAHDRLVTSGRLVGTDAPNPVLWQPEPTAEGLTMRGTDVSPGQYPPLARVRQDSPAMRAHRTSDD